MVQKNVIPDTGCGRGYRPEARGRCLWPCVKF